MDRTLVGTVEASYTIKSRGTSLAVLFQIGAKPVYIGSRVKLVLPEGRQVNTQVTGIGLGGRPQNPHLIHILLPELEEVGAGTQIYLLEEGEHA